MKDADVLDLAFLRDQTFGDDALERDVLSLFLVQGRRVLAAVAAKPVAARLSDAHLLKGSGRGIGAWALADAAAAYEDTPDEQRLDGLRGAFDATALAVERRLAAMGDATTPVQPPDASLKGP